MISNPCVHTHASNNIILIQKSRLGINHITLVCRECNNFCSFLLINVLFLKCQSCMYRNKYSHNYTIMFLLNISGAAIKPSTLAVEVTY